jgi:hypothetical protein
MARLLRTRVADIELLDVACKATDLGSVLGVGVVLVRPGTEPGGMAQLWWQVEPDAHPRPRAVPVGRRVNLDAELDAVRSLTPAIGHVDELTAVGRGGPRLHDDLTMIMFYADDPVDEPVQPALPPALFRRRSRAHPRRRCPPAGRARTSHPDRCGHCRWARARAPAAVRQSATRRAAAAVQSAGRSPRALGRPWTIPATTPGASFVALQSQQRSRAQPT